MFQSPLGAPSAPHARVILAAAALALTAVTTQACALIAGLEDHTLAQGSGGAGGATTTGSGGAAGGGPFMPSWPDSLTATCSNGLAKIPCPTDKAKPYHGQDGDVRLHVPTYTLGGVNDALVTDSVTGLTWRATPLSPMTQPDAKAYCETQLFDNLDGWRLPSRIELLTLIDFGAQGALIDQTAFPKVAPLRLWTSTEHLVTSPPGDHYWSVDFGCTPGICDNNQGSPGGSHGTFVSTTLGSLCVRGPEFTVGPLGPPKNGTVTDPHTRLTWESKVSQASTTTWVGAVSYCHVTLNQNAFATYTDWRLPSIKELQTLADDQLAVAPALFAGIVEPNENYLWSATPVVEASPIARAYVLFTFDGSNTTLLMSESYGEVHCVRGGE